MPLLCFCQIGYLSVSDRTYEGFLVLFWGFFVGIGWAGFSFTPYFDITVHSLDMGENVQGGPVSTFRPSPMVTSYTTRIHNKTGKNGH